jgi:hypothetical protein
VVGVTCSCGGVQIGAQLDYCRLQRLKGQ